MKSIRLSIFSKVMLSIGIVLMTAIFIIEVSYVVIIDRYKRNAMELYQGSLNYYESLWHGKLKMINTSLLTMISRESGELFMSICNSDDVLTVEQGKIELKKYMDEIVELHDGQAGLVVYIPQKEIYISSSQAWSYSRGLEVQKVIRTHILKEQSNNDNRWDILMIDDLPYLFQVYRMDDGYACALIDCSLILEGLWGEQEDIDGVEICYEDGEKVQRMGDNLESKGVLYFTKKLEYTDIYLKVLMKDTALYRNRGFVLLLFTCAIVSVIMVMINMEFQKRRFFGPLERLQQGMQRFGDGKIDERMPEYHGTGEIRILYQVFNHMADQITNLRIQVYEGKIENQRIQSDYLKIQIQPHFYVNILNLIFGFAQLKDYASIQTLSQVTARYFRYLLGEKRTFVMLKEELACLRSYSDIQKIRYGDRVEFSIDVQEEIDEQLVLPLMIQTFVENSVKHNITLVPVLRSKVKITMEGRYLKIRIEDNGTGFDQEMMQKLNQGESISRNGEHIGIQNVRERIRFFYQEDAEFRIESVPGKTAIELALPQVI